jgi:hypothetical protein
MKSTPTECGVEASDEPLAGALDAASGRWSLELLHLKAGGVERERREIGIGEKIDDAVRSDEREIACKRVGGEVPVSVPIIALKAGEKITKARDSVGMDVFSKFCK